jgi:hypothetical protein
VNLVVGVTVKQLAHRLFAVGVPHLCLEELQIVVCVSVNDSDSNIIVGVVRVGRLVKFRGTGRNNVGRVQLAVHCVGLASIDHEEDLVISRHS